MKTKKQKRKENSIVLLSMMLLIISIGLQTVARLGKEEYYKIEYEYINTKDMAAAKIVEKNPSQPESKLDSMLSLLLITPSVGNENGTLEEITLENRNALEEVATPVVEKTKKEEPKAVWHLPTEIGRVTQSPHYGHAALDITSPRGTGEIIYPVANGVISGIYTDPAGALVVTVLHNVNGMRYTSQYAHLSSYATGIYVGKEVTINDALGRMGSTGYSTGVHLHLAVLDCALFNPKDTNCYDLNAFFRYANTRVSQGYLGLGSYIIVPGSWDSRN